jgi:hypothetical protein
MTRASVTTASAAIAKVETTPAATTPAATNLAATAPAATRLISDGQRRGASWTTRSSWSPRNWSPTYCTSPRSPTKLPGWGELRRRLIVICLCLYPHGRGIVVEVWDRSERPPVRRAAAADDESGRGLELVSMLSTRWGYRWPRTGGKWNWAMCDR